MTIGMTIEWQGCSWLSIVSSILGLVFILESKTVFSPPISGQGINDNGDDGNIFTCLSFTTTTIATKLQPSAHFISFSKILIHLLKEILIFGTSRTLWMSHNSSTLYNCFPNLFKISSFRQNSKNFRNTGKTTVETSQMYRSFICPLISSFLILEKSSPLKIIFSLRVTLLLLLLLLLLMMIIMMMIMNCFYRMMDKRKALRLMSRPMSEILIIVNLRRTASRIWTCAEPEFSLCWRKLPD